MNDNTDKREALIRSIGSIIEECICEEMQKRGDIEAIITLVEQALSEELKKHIVYDDSHSPYGESNDYVTWRDIKKIIRPPQE